ncbi:ribbon-helix-helix domain-containing protein, partial [Pseudomonas helleri]
SSFRHGSMLHRKEARSLLYFVYTLLEEIYWEVLSDISQCNHCSINALLSYIDREIHLRHGGVKNFSGLIRVVCVMHLMKGDRSVRGVLPEQMWVG